MVEVNAQGILVNDPNVTVGGTVVLVDVADSNVTVTVTAVSESTVEAVAASTSTVGG